MGLIKAVVILGGGYWLFNKISEKHEGSHGRCQQSQQPPQQGWQQQPREPSPAHQYSEYPQEKAASPSYPTWQQQRSSSPSPAANYGGFQRSMSSAGHQSWCNGACGGQCMGSLPRQITGQVGSSNEEVRKEKNPPGYGLWDTRS